jgi:hypothetical protein
MLTPYGALDSGSPLRRGRIGRRRRETTEARSGAISRGGAVARKEESTAGSTLESIGVNRIRTLLPLFCLGPIRPTG